MSHLRKGSNRMISEERLEALRARHGQLEAAIDDEIHRPHPDDMRLSELKREKLRVKEEIEGLRA